VGCTDAFRRIVPQGDEMELVAEGVFFREKLAVV